MYMTLAGLMFTIMLAAVKVARQELPTLEVIWWRSAVAIPLSYLLARQVSLVLIARGVFVLRAAFGFTAMVCFYFAAGGLAVTDLSILHKLQPILVGLLAPLLLGRAERAGAGVWLLLTTGLVGCAILLAPSLEVGNTYGLWALGGAASSAFAHIFVRALGETDDPRTIVLWFMCVSFALTSLALLVTTGTLVRVPSPELLVYLIAIGATATAGQMLMTLAYKRDRAPVVAAAAYSAPLFAVGIDVVAFDAVPAGHVLIGGAIIVGAGLILLLRREPATIE
jgi:drug/metabolite transporter (DMT)-like permease